MRIKDRIEDLSVFGGQPIFKGTLHVGFPNVGNKNHFLNRVNEIFNRNWLTNNGFFVQAFEKKIEDFVGVKHCIVMTNGTIALEIAIKALGMTGEVIAPSFTFIATAHALKWQGINPVFCDIDEKTHNINPDKIEGLINDKTTGIVATHLWGRPCEIDLLSDIAKKNNLKLLFDAAHAFGCSYKGKMIGRFGNAEVFSFHATKFFNTFEGGAIVTNDDELAKKIRLMKNFGFSGMDNVIYIGTNGKMSEISAAMGLTSFESMDDFIAINKSNYYEYKQLINEIDGISIIDYNEKEKNNYQYIVTEINEKKFGLSRNVLVDILQKENIRARRYFYPGCHKMEPYKTEYNCFEHNLAITEKISNNVLILPTGKLINNNIINKICYFIKFIHQHSSEISKSYLEIKE